LRKLLEMVNCYLHLKSESFCSSFLSHLICCTFSSRGSSYKDTEDWTKHKDSAGSKRFLFTILDTLFHPAQFSIIYSCQQRFLLKVVHERLPSLLLSVEICLPALFYICLKGYWRYMSAKFLLLIIHSSRM